MKILIDNQILSRQRFGGISRYICDLFIELKKIELNSIKLPLILSNNIYAHNLKLNLFNLKISNSSYLRKAVIVLNSLYQTLIIFLQRPNIIHLSYYSLPWIKLKAKTIITVYDLTEIIYPQFFPKNNKTPALMKKAICKADRIIAISQSTKKDIINHFNIPEDRIDVVYLSSSIKNSPSPLPINIVKPYILFIGRRDGYKNFTFFARAIANILKEKRDLFVVCGGGGKFNSLEELLFKELGCEGKFIQYDFCDVSLYSLYNESLFFVFPSLYEGFGIPVLEAYLSSTPCLLASTSSLVEIGGDAALYFNLAVEQDLQEKLNLLINNQQLRIELKNKGLERAKLFSSEKVAHDTLNSYKKALNNLPDSNL